jgi:hypothetical protein
MASSQGQTANRVLIHVDTELGAGYAGTAYRTRHDVPICVTRIFSSHEGGQSLPDLAQGSTIFFKAAWSMALGPCRRAKKLLRQRRSGSSREEVTASLAVVYWELIGRESK